jgi:hypothetical protein
MSVPGVGRRPKPPFPAGAFFCYARLYRPLELGNTGLPHLLLRLHQSADAPCLLMA